MLVSQITKLLPASLEWMVLFNLTALGELFEKETIQRMFFLPPDVKLKRFSHVVLTSQGTVLATSKGQQLIKSEDGQAWPVPENSFHARFNDQMSRFPLDEADCLGAGELEHYFPPVLLFLKIISGIGQAKALFQREPTQEQYELLSAIGVSFKGGEWIDNIFQANFTVDLSSHIRAGEISDFSKTGYCNAFFLQHGRIGPTLEKGLLDAVFGRIGDAQAPLLEALNTHARNAMVKPQAMRCQPPPPAEAFEFGDMVPLGFLLDALKRAAERDGSTTDPEQISSILQENNRGGLWGFQSGDIATSTDSALILKGLQNPDSIQALEVFADGNGGYFPQLEQDDGRFGAMQSGDFNRHWCQSDFATACLVRGLRKANGLESMTTLNWIQDQFDKRSGLYFANPYIVDWALAYAIHSDPKADQLRSDLTTEILDSMNEDHTFGSYDILLSTAFAILSLSMLGVKNQEVLLSQLHLASMIKSQTPHKSPRPFYSSMKLPDLSALLQDNLANQFESTNQIVQLGDQYHAISYYIDQHHIIRDSICYLAITEDVFEEGATQVGQKADKMDPHLRYRCRNHDEYVTKFALPPYLEPTT